jgi:hypothetical protein
MKPTELAFPEPRMSIRGRFATLAVVAALATLALSLPGAAEAQYFGQNKIAYRQFDWRIYHSPHFDVYYYPEAEASLEKVVSFAESAYDVLSREFDFQIKEPTPLIYYATHSEFEQNNIILNFIPEGVGAFAVPARRRMVMPVDLPDKELLELIAHELTHVFQYHILFQGKLRAPIGQSPPQWLMEGMASYMAEDEGARERMFLRDAVVNDQVPPITQAPNLGFFSYRFGHAVFDFMENRWGKDGFRDFVYEYRNSFGAKVDKAIERAFRLKPEDFDIEFRRWLRKKYLPELVRTGEPSDFGRPFVRPDDEPAYQIAPVASPSGDLLAAFSTKDGDVDVVLFDARKRQPIRNLTKGNTQKFRYFVAQELELGRKMGHDLAFSPDGNSVAVLAKREQARSLVILDALKGGIRRIVDLGDVEQQVGLAWHPDGDRVAFSGHRGGRFDIFEVSLSTGEVKNLTNDEPFDGSPAYSRDGKSLVYTSIPAVDGKLVRLRLDDGMRETLTDGPGSDKDAAFSRDGKTIYFSSDRSGIENIYSLTLEGGQVRQLTNAVTGCFMPAALVEIDGSERVVFTGYWKGRFDLYLVDDVAETVGTIAASRGAEEAAAKAVEPIAAEATGGETPAESSPPALRFEPDIRVTIDDANKEDYGKFKLFVEDVGATVGVNTDQTLVSDAYIAFTDTLGDRRLFLQFSSIDTFSNFDIAYYNLKNRWQWGLRLFDDRTYFVTRDALSGRIERGRSAYKETGLVGSLSYPFDIHKRFEVGLGYKYRKIDFQSFALSNGQPVPVVIPRSDDYPEIEVALVGDSTVYGQFGPLSGRRYRIGASYAPDFDKEETLHLDGSLSSTLTQTVSLDFRQYYQVSRRSNLAIRVFGAASEGNFPTPVYFGGLDTVRGFEFRELVGDHGFFANVEYRFPVFDYLIGPFLNFRGIRGRFFLDVGGAWFDAAGQNFDFWDSDESRLKDAVSSYGWGLTLNFSGLQLNWDFAKRWDFKDSLDDGYETSFWIGTQF